MSIPRKKHEVKTLIAIVDEKTNNNAPNGYKAWGSVFQIRSGENEGMDWIGLNFVLEEPSLH